VDAAHAANWVRRHEFSHLAPSTTSGVFFRCIEGLQTSASATSVLPPTFVAHVRHRSHRSAAAFRSAMNRRTLKSVHLTNYYHAASGGVKTNYDRLLVEANRLGRHVTLIVPGETERTEDVGEFGRIRYIAARRSPVVDTRYRLMLPFEYVPSGSAIRRVLLEEAPDIIEIYDNYSLTLLAGLIRRGNFREIGRPMLVYFTGERFDLIFRTFVTDGRFGHWFPKRLLSNYNLAMFDFYIANSDFVAHEIRTALAEESNPRRSDMIFRTCWRFFNGARVPFEERLAVCPRGVDTELFSPTRRSADGRRAMIEQAGFPSDAALLLTATRLSREKNIQILSPIMQLLSADTRAHLIVAGAGPREQWLRDEAEAHFPGRLHLTGHLDKPQLASYYANCDIFIHPNPHEPFGNVGLEAMASGANVLLPRSGGVLAYANEENAWLVEPTAEGYAAGVRTIIDSSHAAAVKRVKAVETAAANSQSKAIGRLFDTYDRFYEAFRRNEALFGNAERATGFDFARIP
jgi:glycosyltransferase involved in cell wall biosynthesis